jgi:hypothetical protein
MLPPDTLWFNGSANGADDAENTAGSSVEFSEFNVTGSEWDINSVWSDDEVFSGGPATVTSMGWEIYSGMNATPTLVASGTGTPTYTATGLTPFGSTEYMFEIDGLNVFLAPGTYWLGVYSASPFVGMYIDTTAGANAVGTPPGNGITYQGLPAGPFSGGGVSANYSEGVAGLSGVPEPSPAISLGTGLLLLAASRLRAKKG